MNFSFTLILSVYIRRIALNSTKSLIIEEPPKSKHAQEYLQVYVSLIDCDGI